MVCVPVDEVVLAVVLYVGPCGGCGGYTPITAWHVSDLQTILPIPIRAPASSWITRQCPSTAGTNAVASLLKSVYAPGGRWVSIVPLP